MIFRTDTANEKHRDPIRDRGVFMFVSIRNPSPHPYPQAFEASVLESPR